MNHASSDAEMRPLIQRSEEQASEPSGRTASVIQAVTPSLPSQRWAGQLFQSLVLAVSRSASFEMALSEILHRICQTTAWDYGEAWIPSADDSRLELSPIWYGTSECLLPFRKVSEQFTFPRGVGLPGRVWERCSYEWIADVTCQPQQVFWRVDAALDANLHAGLAVPVLVQDQVLAVLAFFMSQAHEPDPQQIEFISAFATQLGAIIQLKQTEAALSESQRRLTTLINSLPGIVYTCANDPDWSMTYLSDGCMKLTGYRSEDLVGKRRCIRYNDLVHPDDLPTVLQTIDTAIAQRQPYVVEYRIRTKTGEEKWLWEKGYGITDEIGTILGLEGFITDITERKQAERALQEKETFLQLILDNIPQHIFWKDRNLIYQGGNKTWLKSIGLHHPQEIVGKTDGDLWPPEQAQRYRETDRQILETKQQRLHITQSKVHADGHRVWLDINKVPIHNAEGHVIGVLGTLEDITERRRAEAALAKREQYLAALVKVQRHLLNFQWDSDADLYGEILSLLGQVSGASRTSAFEVCRDATGHLLTRQQAGWCTDGIPAPSYPPPQQSPAYERVMTRWLDVLCCDRIITGSINDFPETERQVLESQGILSILILPLKVSGEFFGFIEFDNCLEAQPWEASEIDLLQAATAAIALVQEHRQTKESLKQAEAKYRGIFENAVEGIFQTTAEGQYLTVNPMLARIYGYDSPADLIASITNIEHQLYVDPQRRVEFVHLMQEQGAVLGFESQIRRKDGSVIWISECARAIHDARGKLIGYEGTVEDITRRKHAEAELIRRDDLLQGVAEAATSLLTNPDFNAAIPEALEILGKAAGSDRVYIYENHPHPETGELAMSMRFEWTHPTVAPSITQPHWQNQPYSTFGMNRWYKAFKMGHSISGLVREFPALEQDILSRDNILAILMVPIFIDEQLWGYVGLDACQSERQWTASEESILVAIAASIGGAIKRQRTEAQMRYQAFHDTLTGLPNRMLFNEHLPIALAHARRVGEMLAVMFLDLDRFKTINDTLGHAVGDLLLQQATQRLRQSLRQEDIIARWGGDEFTLIVPHLTSAEDAAKIAQRISAALKPSFKVDGHELHITSSLGIALYPQDGKDLQTLLKNADTALYRAKEEGRNNYQFYTATLNSHASELLILENHLHQALELNEFILHYQPQVNTATGEVTKMEALLRWQHSQFGLIPPKTFIALAEENGLIVPIGEWVLRTACVQARAWQQAGFPGLRVAVNLSARQFQQPQLLENISHILQETQLPPECLEVEITETAAMRDVDFTSQALHELRATGIRISMDDFGTGYSSLAYLKRFPLDALKIDQSFIRDLIDSPDDEAIVTAIIALGQGFNLSVVAEGVETEAQKDRLSALQCREMQGYWFSPPLAAEQATEYLQRHRCRKVL